MSDIAYSASSPKTVKNTLFHWQMHYHEHSHVLEFLVIHRRLGKSKKSILCCCPRKGGSAKSGMTMNIQQLMHG